MNKFYLAHTRIRISKLLFVCFFKKGWRMLNDILIFKPNSAFLGCSSEDTLTTHSFLHHHTAVKWGLVGGWLGVTWGFGEVWPSQPSGNSHCSLSYSSLYIEQMTDKSCCAGNVIQNVVWFELKAQWNW